MKWHLVLAAVLLAANTSIAAAQSSTATSGTTAPMPAPVAGNAGTAPNKVVIPPAARSGEKGLRVGNDAVGEPIEVKRVK